MKKLLSVFVLGILFFSFSAMINTSTTTAHIHKVLIDVDESLMERRLIKTEKGDIAYSQCCQEVFFADELDFEYLPFNRVNTILKDLAEIVKTKKGFQSVTTADAKRINASNILGNIVSNATGRTKMQHFPNVRLKKSTKKFDADEYFTIKMVFQSPNRSTMNKNYQGNTLSFNVKIKITSTNKKGDLLWEKEEEIKEFSSIIDNSFIDYDNESDFFTILREPRLFHKYKNRPIGDFNSLSLNEFAKCIKSALDQVINN